MANASVERFRRLTAKMQDRVRADAIAELGAQSDRLVATMKSVVTQGPTGNLASSIRKERGKTDTRVLVMAGGFLTTRRLGGKPYDYARAVEFGTESLPAKPFFFPTYRLMRKSMRSAMRRRITARIKEYSAE